MANDNTRRRQDGRSYSFTMSMTDVVWTGVGVAFALTVFFLFGVLVGRGYVPTEPIEEVAVRESTHGQLEEVSTEPTSEAVAEPETGVLKAEDLAYQDQLADQDQKQPGAAPATKTGQAATEVQESQEGLEGQLEGTGASTEADAAGASAGYDPSALPAPEPGEGVFSYTYQAAAFKDAITAEVLVGQLKEKNLDARMVEGKTSSATWYRVQIPFIGAPSQTVPLRDAIQAVTGEKPVMVSKKAVE
ncbi:MAG: SPOR domain-containing protein [Proteobacteria bacterium]|nr:SPOR domain-containing protein [Pseudomonadota bacterium]MBU1610525.1 SPOR domain-containing protein [Pseudomonadota bacterium]